MRLDVNVDAYVPADYIPYEQAKVDVHRRIAGAREVADLVLLREELEDRFGELPEPMANLISLQQARIKLGQAGARAVTFRGDRLAVTPVELDSVRAKKIRAEIPEALYESGKSQLSVRVPKDPGQRFPAVVRAADVLLAVTREAEEDAARPRSPSAPKTRPAPGLPHRPRKSPRFEDSARPDRSWLATIGRSRMKT